MIYTFYLKNGEVLRIASGSMLSLNQEIVKGLENSLDGNPIELNTSYAYKMTVEEETSNVFNSAEINSNACKISKKD